MNSRKNIDTFRKDGISSYSVSKKTKFNQYDYVEDINPDVVRQQRIPGGFGGTADNPKISFRGNRALPDALLLAKATIKWEFNFRKIRDANPDVNNAFDRQDRILLKPYDVISNATREMTLTLNSKSITYYNSRYWSKYLGLINAGVANNHSYFSTSGGDFLEGTGIVNDQGDTLLGGDIGHERSIAKANHNFISDANANPTTTFSFLQYLNIGVFNPYYDFKDNLPYNSWYKKMSNLIPYIDQLQIDINLNKPASNFLQPNYLFNNGGNANVDPVILRNEGVSSAELILQWVKPNKAMVIPQTVRLPAWNVEHRQIQINAGAVVDSGDTVSFASDFLHFHSIPTMILLFATNDKDDANYVCRAIQQDTDRAGRDQVVSEDVNSGENNMIMDNTFITIDFNNEMITSKYTREEIYNITKKNSCRDYPYAFHAFIGGQGLSNADVSSFNASQFHMLLRSDDLNIVRSTGKLQTDFLIKIQSDLTAESGYGIGNTAQNLRGNKSYNFHVVLFHDKFYYDINEDGRIDCQYESVFP